MRNHRIILVNVCLQGVFTYNAVHKGGANGLLVPGCVKGYGAFVPPIRPRL